MYKKIWLLAFSFLFGDCIYAAQAKPQEALHALTIELQSLTVGGKASTDFKEAKDASCECRTPIAINAKYQGGAEELYHKALSSYERTKDSEAVAMMEYAASLGSAPASYWLGGYYYDHSDSRIRDLDVGYNYFLVAANQGNIDAQCCIGDMYCKGKSPLDKKDEAVALSWYEKAADNRSSWAIESIFSMAWHGYNPAWDCLEKRAESDQDIQYLLGRHYYFDERFGSAYDYLTKAAETGHIKSWDLLLSMAERGWKRAVHYFDICAHQKNASMQALGIYYLGRYYFNHARGNCVVADCAFFYLKRAAKEPYELPQAQYYFGLCYWYGFGVEQNTAEAKKWIDAANSSKADGEVCFSDVTRMHYEYADQ